MGWIQIDGKNVWSEDIGRKYCQLCGEIIPKPPNLKRLSRVKRAAYTNTKFCSSYCQHKNWWNSQQGIKVRRERRYRYAKEKRTAEYQRRYRAKWRDKINERRRLKRAMLTNG